MQKLLLLFCFFSILWQPVIFGMYRHHRSRKHHRTWSPGRGKSKKELRHELLDRTRQQEQADAQREEPVDQLPFIEIASNVGGENERDIPGPIQREEETIHILDELKRALTSIELSNRDQEEAVAAAVQTIESLKLATIKSRASAEKCSLRPGRILFIAFVVILGIALLATGTGLAVSIGIQASHKSPTHPLPSCVVGTHRGIVQHLEQYLNSTSPTEEDSRLLRERLHGYSMLGSGCEQSLYQEWLPFEMLKEVTFLGTDVVNFPQDDKVDFLLELLDIRPNGDCISLDSSKQSILMTDCPGTTHNFLITYKNHDNPMTNSDLHIFIRDITSYWPSASCDLCREIKGWCQILGWLCIDDVI